MNREHAGWALDNFWLLRRLRRQTETFMARHRASLEESARHADAIRSWKGWTH